jgi:hypothetical protein
MTSIAKFSEADYNSIKSQKNWEVHKSEEYTVTLPVLGPVT